MSDLIRRSDGRYVEPPGPSVCVNGHPLKHPNVGVGWANCSCTPQGGHRTWRCYTCGEMTYRPGHVQPIEIFTGRWK